ncbi:ABC transporter ATP-binding protein [Rhizobium sp. AG207R]|uniref:ABC transporter ATP-binding protein n=1 Tax=Rhizobium sp. AG207R TaxID=2802287 RepID=UPI0022ABF7A2|nr:ABC transporter ATP-binding protein [Rhizobium sp. AG207R]MCZ3374369.1 ABC transporter ATP-binding protein [Rhizobium sp. AG207R]
MGSLSIVGLTRRYGSFTALNNVSVEAGQGEFLTLLGPSGCGKSTLLGIIAGLDYPTSGEVQIDGTDVSGTLARDRDIAMIFQSYALYPTMTVRKNIEFGLKIRGVAAAERAKAIQSVATMLRIDHLLDRKPWQLSGGQRQRVAMGRALVRNPKLFLFDEPLSNLDAQLRTEMRIEIKRLHQKLGATIVYVTHDQVEAMTMSTKIVVMNGGKIVQIGTPNDIYNSPADLFVAKFVGSPAMNLLEGTVEDAKGTQALRISPKLAIALPSGFAVNGQEVTLGIRPENITIGENLGENCLALDARVDLVEPTGADTLVIFDLVGKEVTARTAPTTKISADQTLKFGFSQENYHLFDTKSGVRLNQRGAAGNVPVSLAAMSAAQSF